MKKTMLLVAPAAMSIALGCLSACGSGASESASSSQPASVPEENTNTPVAESSEAEEAATSESIETADTEVTISEQEIYNQDGLSVTVTGLELDGLFGPEITVLLQNDSDKNVTVQTRNSSINGYMIDLQMSCDVAPGKKSNDGMIIPKANLEEAGIDTLSDIEFSLHFLDSSSFDDIADSGIITLSTNASGTYTQTYDDSGDVLYDNDGIRIISKGLVADDNILGPEFLLYIENNSEKGITVQARDTSVNGFMIEPSLSADVIPGKKSISGMVFMNSQLEENKITELEEIETSFHIFESDSWETIVDTDPIIISVK